MVMMTNRHGNGTVTVSYRSTPFPTASHRTRPLPIVLRRQLLSGSQWVTESNHKERNTVIWQFIIHNFTECLVLIETNTELIVEKLIFILNFDEYACLRKIPHKKNRLLLRFSTVFSVYGWFLIKKRSPD